MARMSSEMSNSPSSQAGSTTCIRPRKTSATPYREAWRKLAKVRKPMPTLDERFRYPASTSVPTLHYGLGYTKKSILYCAQKLQLLPPQPLELLSTEKEARRFAMAVTDVKEYLENKLDIMLFFHSSITPGYLGVISLHSNYTGRMLYRPKKEKEILNFIRRELNVRKQQAAWHWDSQHGLAYVCVFVIDAMTQADYADSYSHRTRNNRRYLALFFPRLE
ncbi:hypothetical protein PENSPDRAFT_277227 [Peniophora sp. CONT]|nr:hypothetical protein PENSPDRAFT_277227 [Peniophora sp. CONT]